MLLMKHCSVRHYFNHNGPIQIKPTPYIIPSCNGYVVPRQENVKTISVNYAEDAHLKEDCNFSHINKSHYDYPLRDSDGKGQEKERDNEETFSPYTARNDENKIYRE